MKPLSFHIISDKTLLSVFLTLLWGVADSNAESTPGTSSTTAVTTAPISAVLTALEPMQLFVAPDNVRSIRVTDKTENSITLEWDKVNNIPSYFVQYQHNGDKEVLINDTSTETTISHVVTDLTAGTKYNFIVITTLNGASSTGTIKETFTRPRNANDFKYIDQSETSITPQWTKVENDHYEVEYDSGHESFTVSEWGKVGQILDYALEFGGNVMNITAPKEHQQVTSVKVTRRSVREVTLEWTSLRRDWSYSLHINGESYKPVVFGGIVKIDVGSLDPGTVYPFSVTTTFFGHSSEAYEDFTVTRPRNVNDFKYIDQNETSITLQWTKVENDHYEVEYNSGSESFTVSEETVTRTISDLIDTTEYIFTLFTLFEDDRSTGVSIRAFTAPPNPDGLIILGQNQASITLQWKRVANLSYKLGFNETFLEEIPAVEGQATVTKTIHGLTRGTIYNLSLFAVFHNISSSGLRFTVVTAPGDAEKFNVAGQNETSITLQWEKVDGLPDYTVMFNENKENINSPGGDSMVTFTASGLQSGTKYEFRVFTVFENVTSSGVTFTAVTVPRNTDKINPVEQNETTITLEWTKVEGIFNYTLEYDGNKINIPASEGTKVTISDLTNTTKYNFILFTVFEDVKSSGAHISAATAPPNTENFGPVDQNETSITLRWEKVGEILNYELEFDGNVTNITAPKEHQQVTTTVPKLESGTKYTFRVFALFENVRSSGRNLVAATVPLKVTSVKVTRRSVRAVTLEWTSLRRDWSYSLHINGESYKPSVFGGVVECVVRSLDPGTVYPFSVTTTFFGHSSEAYEDFTVTTIHCASGDWQVTNSTITGMINGEFTNATASNKSETHTSTGSGNVSFTGLYPGETYEVELVLEKDSRSFNQCDDTFTITTIPPVVEAYCEYSGSGYSALIGWNEPPGIWDSMKVVMSGEIRTIPSDMDPTVIIFGFQPAKTYKVHVTTRSRERQSPEFVFSCSTDPRGVIARSVIGVLLFVALVAFILFKRPDLIRRNKPFISGTEQNNKKSKTISVDQFPDHFYQLSADANRGFSEEYENLAPVGTEQTRKEACLPENKPRNRFNNVLPYDWCLVKLTSLDADGMSDYINANYMPGYNSSREYIATQGPLPSTVNDFWRMIWEQRVKGIVMVTNCKESGKTKCEQYWPGDQRPVLCGELLVTMTNEQQEPNWTLREFTLKHKNYSEVCKVKHFHFTAWPDHRVPQGTEVLIQFRGLVRQHIEREGTGAPTVVHSSAGVGRTGTIIALDVLLQQLEKERAVGIYSFVHKMRLSRPYMVQTESQYVFLHQCIMDSLHQNENSEENIYENEDIMYVNATALREFRSAQRHPSLS
ncbi:receptor-type tyrosine-protein phosphatase H-like isoform X1 [Xyrichtys novacula]|uniref:protein-tyrosine-phosphatase n=1 Tax=Xyrichtys novacula TaxID=13765 RepID=A0AAV1HP26_XYRNO|nr:receptor-type tyrosine-protein phosphatase H-like isoform X1 [Xyrichtys novacula]